MSLLLKVKPLVVSPVLATRIGLNEAIVLQQICYWLEDTASGVEHDGKRWVYNTIEEWASQFPFWSEKTIKRALTSLREAGLIYVEQLKKSQHDRTNYYAINHANPLLTDGDNLTPSKGAKRPARKGHFVPVDKDTLNPSIGSDCPDLTENTTENTTEITTNPLSPVAAQPDNKVEEFVSRHPEAVVHNITKRQWGNAEDLRCAQWIWEQITRLYEVAAESDGEVVRPKEPNWTTWANDIRLLREQDGRTHKQICELFKRANRDQFWCRNVLSPSKLRDKWDDLSLKLSTQPATRSITDIPETYSDPVGFRCD